MRSRLARPSFLLTADDKHESDPYGQAALAVFILILVKAFWPRFVPFATFSFWHSHGHLEQWLTVSWPVFAWGAGASLLALVLAGSGHSLYRHPAEVFGVGVATSIWAGVVEEICFRWLCFLAAMASVRVINTLFFGFAGFGVFHWLQLRLFATVADFATLHHLHHWLYNPAGWFVGAALLSANAVFRDGHKYLGFFGYVNSWFVGMYLFWVMLTYGLVAAIVVHLVYDLLVCLVETLGAAADQRLGWT